MGTRKKLVLASLVSLMMAMAFVIGLMPAHDGARLSAGSGSSIDMADLLDMVLGLKGVNEIVVTSPIDGVVVKTPEDNAVPEELEIAVPVTASFDGTGSEVFRFGASDLSDPNVFDGANSLWLGDVISDEVSFPFSTGIDVSPFLTGAANVQTSLGIYALLNPQMVNATTWIYEDVNAQPLPITLFETSSAVDADGNGFPDNPFDVLDGIQPGEIWIANVLIDGILRTVLVANLDPGTGAKGGQQLGEIFVSPSGNVQVASPTLADLQAAGLIPAGESGLLIVEVAGDLSVIVDEVDGDPSSSARQAWASAALNAAPGVPTASANFVEISILFTVGGQFDELESLEGSGLSVDLTLNNIGNQIGEAVELYSYPTFVTDQAGSILVTNAPGDNAWRHNEGAVVAGTSLTAALENLSVFVPLVISPSTPIELVAAIPDTIPADEATDVALEGVFGTVTALNVAQAAAAYRVYLGVGTDNVLPFALGPEGGPNKGAGGVAVTAYDGVNNNFMYVTVPADAAEAGEGLDITVVDLNDPTNFATVANLITVEDDPEVCTVTVQTAGDGTGVVTLTPTSGTGMADGDFECGTEVTALASPASGSVFTGWQIDGADAGSDNPFAFTVSGSDGSTIVLTATFELAPTPEFTLTTSASAGGSVTVITEPNGVAPGTYLDGTAVQILASPNAGFAFVGWGGANGGEVTGGAAGTIVMNGNKEVVANFEEETVVSFELNLTAQGGNGTVNVLTPPNAPNGRYLPNTQITIEAVPNAGFQFAGWVGFPVANPASATTSLTITGDVNLTAQFQAIGTGELTINTVTPNEAWIFGGVVAMISGEGFTAATEVTIGGQAAQVTDVNETGTILNAIVPATTDTGVAATVTVDVTVSDSGDTDTLAGGFTYIRHLTEDGVNSTAFILEAPNATNDLEVTLGAPHTTDFAQIILPSLETPAGVTTVFGVARNAAIETDTKQNTGPIVTLGTAGITAGAAVAGSRDFTLHLYANAAVDSAKNTPPAGAAVFPNANALIGFNRPIGPDGQPQASTPIRLSYPLDGVDLTYGDVRNSVTYWGSLVDYDYVSRVATPVDPGSSEYQSEILNTEVLPNVANQGDGAAPASINLARLYTLNGFSLRQNAILSAELAAGIRLNTSTGTASGPMAGGTGLTIVSPGGGIANLDRIVFQNAAKQISGTVTEFDTTPGTTEYEVTFDTPAVNNSGIASIVLFGKADPNTAIVTLERVFEYRSESRNVSSLVLILLGLLVAIIGLAAGGESGSSGGGGPCFIATAAYGTPMAAEIDVLRDVRDTYFLGNVFGTAVTDAYYRVSPAIADTVASSPVAAAAMRVVLLPVIFLGKIALSMPALATFIALSLGFLFLKRSRKSLRV
jgi:hypothetical protein